MLAACRDAVRALDPDIHAWSWLNFDDALERARRLSRTGAPERSGPLHGVPYAVKDIFDTAGIPTEWGTKTQSGRVPDRDCGLVTMLDAAGALMVGKTHTTAFAFFDAAPTRNPHNTAHSPGGSSSGSAAAVAAGMVPLAIGSQTQGSVLRPASFCGVAGLKPTRGLLPLDGVMAFAPTLDHAGLFASQATDLQVAWHALGFHKDEGPTDEIGVLDWPPGDRVEPEMASTFRAAVQRLAAAGLRVRRVPRPGFFDALPDTLRTVMAWEALCEHGERYRAHGKRIGTALTALMEEALKIPESRYQAELDVLNTAREAFATWIPDRTVLATPAAPGPAPLGIQSTGDPRCNAPFTALGVPAVSIPMPVPEGQLPLGMQLVAPSGRDSLLISTASLCERALGTRI